MNGKEEVVSEFLISSTTGKPIVILATPVRGDDGKVNGVLQATINLDAFKNFVAKRSQNGVTAYIVDQDGKIIVHPNEEVSTERKDISQLPFVQKAIKGQSGIEEVVGQDGVRKLVNYEYDPNTRWVICMEKSYDEYNAKNFRLLMITLIVLIINILAVIFISILASKRITKPITQLLDATQTIKNGNLNINISSMANDEIGKLAQNFNAMIVGLKDIIKQVAISAETVSAAAEELTACSEESAATTEQVMNTSVEISNSAEKQVHAANDAAKLVTQIVTNIQQISSDSSTVASVSEKTAQSAVVGGNSIEKAVHQMRNIETNVADSAEVVTKLGERSKEIGQIVDTIAGIAGQTNLLALNAAIEAARAGEQGRGFAVVADEVRKLAEQSQNAAKQIAHLIGEIQTDTDKAVIAMNKGSAEVKLGANMVSGAGSTFAEIITMTNQVSKQIQGISTAIESIAASSQQVVAAIQNINITSEDTARQTKEVSAATGEQAIAVEEINKAGQVLVETAEELQKSVRKFSL
jgi:methyl-accepting chemotaxis protein